LIVSTNENDILQRVINNGEYTPKKVKPSISPSMDIQVASNFERLIFDATKNNDVEVASLMSDLKSKGKFKLKTKYLEYIQKSFIGVKVNDKETKETIEKIYKKYNFIVDPHTAIAIKAQEKIKLDTKTICLATAHPYKFVETIEKIVGIKMETPIQGSFLGPEEKFDVLENDIELIKSFILKRAHYNEN